VLRPSLVPGLLEVLAINASRQMPDARLFEVGNVFSPHRRRTVTARRTRTCGSASR